MSDLISRSELIENFRKCYSGHLGMENSDACMTFHGICNVINNTNTVYDIDKVVEELERIRAKETCNKEKCDTKEICRICVVDDAIEIVKQEAEKFGTDINVVSNGNDVLEFANLLKELCCKKDEDYDNPVISPKYLNDTIENLLLDFNVEYNNGWIPCSERLPEESGYYLVTYHDWSDGNFLPKYDDTYVRRLHYQISEHFVGWNYPKNVDDRAENDCHKEVIAWQSLPEPFKESD